MKFTDGFWSTRADVEALYAAQARELVVSDDTLTVYAPTTVIRHRGDTLNRPLLTVQYSAPMPDVIKVRIVHHSGGIDRGPHFDLPGATGAPAVIEADDDGALLRSGRLAVRVHRGEGWQVEVLGEGKQLTSSGRKAIGAMTTGGKHYLHEQLALGIGDLVYGLGERFGPVVKNGQTVDIWNADGGTSSEQSYKNIPFFLTNAGYGVLVNHPRQVSFEIGSEAVSKVQFSVEGEVLEYFLIYGPTPKEILSRYTELSGRPAQLPDWSFGLWLSTSFTTNYDEATVTEFVDGMAERDLPLSVFHFDCFWMREFHWCDFVWDPATFPDPAGMLQRLKAKGLRICVWINPYIAQRSALFAEGEQLGYLVRRPDGSVWQWDNWQAGMGLVDFTNPDAGRWYAGQLRELMDIGVDCFKTDFGERVPTDVVWHDGSDPLDMHNYYTQLYNGCVFDLLRTERGEGEAVLFARSATAGGQQFPVHWGGDSDSTFPSMAESLRGGLSLALSGFGYWSHDIGGFEGAPDPAVFKRWVAFGLMSSHSRLHGSSSYRVPWAFDEEAVDVLRHFTKLKMQLMPYLGGAAAQASGQGVPMMRPMLLEFPEDPATFHLDTQYMLGDSLLVAPVFSAAGDVSYYLPAGTWTHLETGACLEGGRWVHERHGFDSMPLMVRPGTVLPIGAGQDGPEYDWADGVRLRLYQIPDSFHQTLTVRGTDGPHTWSITRTGHRIVIGAQEARTIKPWQVELVGVHRASAAGAQVSPTPLGLLVVPDEASGALTIDVD